MKKKMSVADKRDMVNRMGGARFELPKPKTFRSLIKGKRGKK